ncbi:14412_t:CDS:2 [Cetraspora pellucida]|uniref:14412_t:CDS:1 n=1 Tax=Cetraspora pellucida TaxID=1433469 RepID=A0A9N8VIS4_9GLOM|nr:14412_t:CDS:2 [Cetraspora pellucida]
MSFNNAITNNATIQDNTQQVSNKERNFANINDTSFILAEEMDKLPTKIYKKNIIPNETCEQRQEHAIKYIYPNHQTKPEVELLFANKLKDVIKDKNEETKKNYHNKTSLIKEDFTNVAHKVYGPTTHLIGNEAKIFNRMSPNLNHINRKRSRGKTMSLLFGMGQNSWRLVDTKYNKEWIRTYIANCTIKNTSNSIQSNVFISGKICTKIRDQESLGTEGHNQDFIGQTMLFIKTFFDFQEVRKATISYRLAIPKCFHATPKIQDKRH